MPEPSQDARPSPEQRMRSAYETAESTTAKAFEQAVGTSSFGTLLARSAENVAAMSRISSDVADLVLRNLRLAGRADITRLARQLHRTEDKLERVLQEVEQLRDELAAREAASGSRSGSGPGTGSRPVTGAGNGRAARSGSRSPARGSRARSASS